jgi:hypothetical protein
LRLSEYEIWINLILIGNLRLKTNGRQSNYDFHVPLRQTILIKDVWLASSIYPQKKKKKNVHLSLMCYAFRCTDLGLFMVRAYLIRMTEKRKRKPYCVIFSKQIYRDIRSITFAHFFLPCFHYSRVHQEYRVDQQHQVGPENHFDRR